VGWTDERGCPVQGTAGKSLRGCLALWTAEQCGGSAEAGLPVATAVEWIHNFTLVHDDIQDGDRERRHRPTVWAVYGEAQAINAGDGLHALAYRALLEGRDHPSRRLRAAAALNRAVIDVIAGQCQDLDLEGSLDASAATYARMARAKTGALVGAAMEAAALMSGAAGRRASLLRRAGIELGLAFQVRDDWLGIWGDSALTGKGRGDIARRKITYPVVLALATLAGSARREFRTLYSRRDGGEDRIRAVLDAAGTAELMAGALLHHGSNALSLVECAGLDRAAVADFESIVAFAAERTS